MEQGQNWWQRVQTLQHQLYQLREYALKENNRDAAEQCKRLLNESERLYKEKAQSWIAKTQRLLEQQGVEPHSDTSGEQ